MLITMGCGGECPYVLGLERDDWPLPDPQGKDLQAVRLIRDEIAARIERLIRDKGVGRSG
jgi:protein-tyrosine-phosphatase